MVKVEFDHNNSGGFWWLNATDWAALEAAGWQRECEEDGWCPQRATIDADSIDAAKAQWAATLPHFNPDDEGCSCCGNPFRFDLWEE